MLASLALFFSSQARADIGCWFNIESVNVTPDGWVGTEFTQGSIYRSWWICSTAGSTVVNDGYGSKTVTSDACRAIYTQMLTMKAGSHQIMLVYHGPADCSDSSMPASGSPSLFPAGFVYK
jgi:hypothetical protein